MVQVSLDTSFLIFFADPGRANHTLGVELLGAEQRWQRRFDELCQFKQRSIFRGLPSMKHGMLVHERGAHVNETLGVVS